MPRARFFSTCKVLILTDFSALVAALLLAYALRQVGGGGLPLALYLNLVPVLLLFLALYASLGLYPGIMRPPSEELKRITLGTTLGFLFLSLLLFLGQQGINYSRVFILLAWGMALFTLPLFRYGIRRKCANQPWWGYPVLLFGIGHKVAEAEREFDKHKEVGLYVGQAIPTDQLAGTPGAPGTHPCPDERLIEDVLIQLRDTHPRALAFIIGDGLEPAFRQQLIILAGRHFRQVLVHLDSPWINQITLQVAEVPGGQVLTLRQNLLDPARMRIKRLLDIALCLMGGVFLVALIPLIALCIRLDSKGPVFFTQKRIGENGKTIRVFKFRTMVANAQEVLTRVLAEHPDLRREWERDQKLTNDPRLTRVGAFLRRTSLDELPQIFNVVKGEMSLVGPRPIVESEIAKYGETFALYTRVKPGITGLWQVSGRNDVSYQQRVALDQHYVYNWSIWLDIYIIIRTFPALFTRRGAY